MGMLKKYVRMFREDMKIAMQNRCGLDELNNFIMLVAFVYIVIALFTGKKICIILAAVFVALTYFRVFSKKLEQRNKENAIYMRYMGGMVEFKNYCIKSIKMLYRTQKDEEYMYFVCLSCQQIIRVPKGKNKVSIRCPKCSKTYVKRT